MNHTSPIPEPIPEPLPNLIRSDGPGDAPIQLLLAHGAGAGMDHPFMQEVATGLAQRGIRVVRFEFPYMQKRRADGGKRPPDRMPKLIEAFADQLNRLRSNQPASARLFIGGKSMGGRVASLLAADPQYKDAIAGTVCLGFPFHPPAKPDKYRGDHLSDIDVPLLILQGDRDTMGNYESIQHYPLSHSVTCRFLADGDHSFKPRKRSGRTLEDNLADAITHIDKFIQTN